MLNIRSHAIINVFLCPKSDILVGLKRQIANGGMREHMQGNSRGQRKRWKNH